MLDDKVISAPVIREPILGGRGQISGSFTLETANQLAIQLRSGALPAKLTIVEERNVGPSLGSDSIEAGKLAGIIGGIATIVLTVLAYGTFGIFAVVGLLVHGVLTVALMTLLGSALTLPGIAGLVLGIAMAVDANVLIYERIREEVRAGKTPIAAIDAGFTRAFVTIADSQLTTLACALVMFWLGAGPDPRLRRHAHRRHLHVDLRGRHRRAAAHLLLAELDEGRARPHRSAGLEQGTTDAVHSQFQRLRLLPARSAAAVHALQGAGAGAVRSSPWRCR